MDSVILQSPILIIGFLSALIIFVLAAVKNARFWLTAVSLVIFSFTLTYALLAGAELYEAGCVSCVFLIVALAVYARGAKK